jgi:hypothetical protein
MVTETEVDGRRVFTLDLPMRTQASKKKKTAVNLNVYRNLHHRSLHAQKKKFEEAATKLLREIPKLGVITLHYEVFVETRRRLDVMNVGSIVDKYFSDTLTEVGIIEDDDWKHLPKATFSYGGLVKKEHVRVTITEIQTREEAKPMRVLLDQNDIQIALTSYVENLNLPNASGVKLGANSHGEITAEIMFNPVADEPNTDDPETIEPPKQRRKRRTKAEIAADAAKEAGNVGAPVQTDPDNGGSGDAPAAEGDAPEGSSEEEATAPEGFTPDEEPKPRKNLFGDKASPSSEGDGQTDETTPGDSPEEPPVKKGSIFDA